MSASDLKDFYDPYYDPDDPTFQPEEWVISIMYVLLLQYFSLHEHVYTIMWKVLLKPFIPNPPLNLYKNT